jgi:hypothetical protein
LYSKRKQSTRLTFGTYIGTYIGTHWYVSVNTGLYRCMSVNEMDAERDGVGDEGLQREEGLEEEVVGGGGGNFY